MPGQILALTGKGRGVEEKKGRTTRKKKLELAPGTR
jgi:hypothetical protein